MLPSRFGLTTRRPGRHCARGGRFLSCVTPARQVSAIPKASFSKTAKTQRNLNQRGWDEARRWGARLREAGLHEVRLFSSRWCRALETAEQMALGRVEPLPALDSFFTSPANEHWHTEALREAVEQLPAGEVAVLVTHQVNITALTGIFPQSGEGLILERPLTTPPKVLTRIAPP